MPDRRRPARLRRGLQRLRCMTYLDAGPPDATTFVAGMGRSGTTWMANLLNHDHGYRVVFEPFRSDVVPTARAFGPFAYVRPSEREPRLVRAAETLLSGRTPRGRVDRLHRGLLFRKRIVKEIRCNLMLGWLRSLRPAMPMIVVIRNPFAVAASWTRLGWGSIEGGSTPELGVILAHQQLLDDFPLVHRALASVDRADQFDRVVAQWCVLHLVPLAHLKSDDVLIVFYEDLLRDAAAELERVARRLDVPVNHGRLHDAIHTAAETDFLGRGHRASRDALHGDWQQHLTRSQVARGLRILDAFGFADHYDSDGFPAEPMRERWRSRDVAGD